MYFLGMVGLLNRAVFGGMPVACVCVVDGAGFVEAILDRQSEFIGTGFPGLAGVGDSDTNDGFFYTAARANVASARVAPGVMESVAMAGVKSLLFCDGHGVTFQGLGGVITFVISGLRCYNICYILILLSNGGVQPPLLTGVANW